MKHFFGLALFCSDPALARAAAAAGIDYLVVDWEFKGKERRQQSYDTQINRYTALDLKTVAEEVDIPVICRINRVGSETKREIEEAIANGAAEILIPMVESLEEVERALDWVRGRCRVGILIETNRAVAIGAELSLLPLERIYVGLNDLSIENGTRNLFLPLANGLLETLREKISIPFGFGGLTLPHLGSPIPCRLLIDEMVRLRSEFSFLRRSFLRDVQEGEFPLAVAMIREAIQLSRLRSAQEVFDSHLELVEKVGGAMACL